MEVMKFWFAVQSLCEPSTDNVTLPPTYGMYGVLANINNVENKEVLLSTDLNPKWMQF
jgi:histidinol-phosphate aminotransferase